MWEHAQTQTNLRTLAERGVEFVGPDVGSLACGWVGAGRMMDPALIVEACARLLQTHPTAPRDLLGRKILITAGPTHEAIDPVRYLGNHSSGKSSFINYVLGRAVQTAGVAPTDDCFTIIAPGPVDRDQDGPAAVTGQVDWGFASLRQFGPTLLHHTVLKVRANIDANFILGAYPTRHT